MKGESGLEVGLGVCVWGGGGELSVPFVMSQRVEFHCSCFGSVLL